jgi:predicted amidophosphoribosyltransferase
MADAYGSVRQMPCPDCGSPVQPEREQLCPRCGYPLMFLRQNGGHDAEAQSIPRRPNERDDPTSLRAVPQPVPQPRTDTRQFPAGSYGAAPGQVQCRACGYPNEPARIRCERCGDELRQARPSAVVLGPPAQQAAPRRAGYVWLIILLAVAVLALIALGLTLLWRFLS